MSILTVAVPSYNAAAYLERCLASLIPFESALEIIIVNDGSTDDTGKIAQAYADRHDFVKVIHKENGGHGSGINAALEIATSPYFKVVDSDDRVDPAAMKNVLDFLSSALKAPNPIDMLITNYVCEVHHPDGEITYAPVRFNTVFAEHRILQWEDLKRMRFNQLIQMHTLIYRTELLQKLPLVLPEKVYYEDNIYAFKPLVQVKRFAYLDVNLYLYYIGRPDQSVSFNSMIKNANMTVTVTEQMICAYRLSEMTLPKKLKQYLIRHLTRMVAMCILSDSLQKNVDLSDRVHALAQLAKKQDIETYRRIYRHPMILAQKAFRVLGPRVNHRFYQWLSKAFHFGT